MHAVVTGASGHLGANLIPELLAHGATVRAATLEPLDQIVPALEGHDVERVELDICDPASTSEAVRGADVVFHLAARISISRHDAELVRRVNVDGVRNVVAACRRQAVGRLVHVSSIHALTPFPYRQAIGDDRALGLDASEPYDASKAAGETIVSEAVKDGLDAVIVRPTAIVGPRDFSPSRIGEMLLRVWRRRLPAITGGGFNWVDVRDVAHGAVQAAELGQAGRPYILSGSWASLSEFFEIAARVGDVSPPRFTTPRWLARAATPFAMAWQKLTGTPSKLTPSSLATLTHYRLVLPEHAHEDLGYRSRPLEETLDDTYRWFVEQGPLASAPRPAEARRR